MTDFDPWAALAAAQSTLANSRSTLATPCEDVSIATSDGYGNSRNFRNSRRGPNEVSQARGQTCKERKKEDIYILQGLTTDEPPFGLALEALNNAAQDTTPARVAILREFRPSDGNEIGNADFRVARVNRPEIAVPGPSDILRAPAEWREGFARLSPIDAPCPGFRHSMEWRATYAAVHAFLEQQAEAAHALGWGTLDLFAVHHVVGGTRVDCCGALMLAADQRVTIVEANTIHFARERNGQPCGRFFRVPSTPEMVAVWEFGR